MAIEKTSVKDIIDKNYAEFDLGLLCEEAYKDLKHIDMVVYTILNNQHGLSVKTTLNGSNRFVDKNGYIFIGIGQDKLCKLLRTTRPTLNASLKRLENVELIQVINTGNMKCNRIYIGKLKRTITLGDYMKNMSIGEEIENEFIPSIDIANIDKIKASNDGTKEATQKSSKNNNYTNSIHQNNKNNTGNYKKTKLHNLGNESIYKYTPEELEEIAKESQKGKFEDLEEGAQKFVAHYEV